MIKHPAATDVFTILGQSQVLPANRDREFLLILFLQEHFHFRISEVLNLHTENLLHDFQIKFIIAKTHDIKIIRDEKIYNQLFDIFSNNSNKGFSVTYKFYYRWLLANHSNLFIYHTKINRTITHTFRKQEARKLQSTDQSEKVIQSSLSHRSKSSQEYYIDKTLKSKKNKVPKP